MTTESRRWNWEGGLALLPSHLSAAQVADLHGITRQAVYARIANGVYTPGPVLGREMIPTVQVALPDLAVVAMSPAAASALIHEVVAGLKSGAPKTYTATEVASLLLSLGGLR